MVAGKSGGRVGLGEDPWRKLLINIPDRTKILPRWSPRGKSWYDIELTSATYFCRCSGRHAHTRNCADIPQVLHCLKTRLPEREIPMTTPITDPFLFDELLTPAQRALRDQVRGYMETVVRPGINDYWERGEIALELALGLRDLPIVGGTQRGYGCAGLDCLSDGLVKYEICRVDGSISTLFGVHSGLAIGSIGMLGSEEQKERWLPAMARMERLGAFALTEPERGSDAAHVQTTLPAGLAGTMSSTARNAGSGTARSRTC